MSSLLESLAGNKRFCVTELKIGSTSMQCIIRNSSITPECNKDEFDPVWDTDIVGHIIWISAKVLCSHILANPNTFNDKRVVELGAGLALPSILATGTARWVVATDNNASTLQLAQAGVALNADKLGDKVHNFMTELLDWNNPIKQELAHKFDIVLAADVIYTSASARAFFNAACGLLEKSEHACILLVHEQRRAIVSTTGKVEEEDSSLAEFLDCCKQVNCYVASIPPPEFVPDDFIRSLDPSRVQDLRCYEIRPYAPPPQPLEEMQC
eukprot:TRINITY_DN32766_c0_g1_i2.p1 TRINITY_DN32766_c0_g1~~TRINITY_DN32766_c0_g1_i2.p1  ORF type:complete len:269 (+),score=26.90 TRINITY_DN32766_c0_g1_i2:42-848(+)